MANPEEGVQVYLTPRPPSLAAHASLGKGETLATLSRPQDGWRNASQTGRSRPGNNGYRRSGIGRSRGGEVGRSRLRPYYLLPTAYCRGFTLMEALIALVIFTIITFAITMSLTTAVRTHALSLQRQEEAGTVRVVFGTLTRDIQAAYASINSPASVFLATGGQNGAVSIRGGSSQNGLLTLTAFSRRIEMPLEEEMQNTASPTAMLPQSDMALIRYDFDPQTGLLTRQITPLPNPQAVMQTPPGPANALAKMIGRIQLRFWDAQNRTWRNEWSYQQQNQTQSPQYLANAQASGAGGATGGTGTTGGTGATGGTNTGAGGNTTTTPPENSATEGDATLPGAVEVTLTIQRKDGKTNDFTTLIPISAPNPRLPDSVTNVTTTSSTSTQNTQTRP